MVKSHYILLSNLATEMNLMVAETEPRPLIEGFRKVIEFFFSIFAAFSENLFNVDISPIQEVYYWGILFCHQEAV